MHERTHTPATFTTSKHGRERAMGGGRGGGRSEIEKIREKVEKGRQTGR